MENRGHTSLCMHTKEQFKKWVMKGGGGSAKKKRAA